MEILKQENRIELKRSVLEKSVVVSGLSNKDLRIAKLSLKKIISEYGMEGKEGLPQKVEMNTHGICRDYGIKTVDKAEIFRFMDILLKYYSTMTLEEVNTAFELALVGELDEYLPKDKNGMPDKNSYQSFSVEFITKILKAYKSYKGRVWVKVHKCIEKEDKPVSEAEKGQIMEDLQVSIEGFYSTYLKIGVLNTMFPVFVCEYLVNVGKLEDREVTKKDISKAVQILAAEERDTDKRKKIFDSLEGQMDSKVLAMANRVKSRELILELFGKMKNEKREKIW